MTKVLIVDDSVEARGHRHNVLGSYFTHTGAACGCHSVYGEVCCILYAMDIVDKPNIQTLDVMRVPQEQCHNS